MIIYLAGPMSGLPRHNFEAFDAAQKQLESEGHCVISPANLSRGLGLTDWDGETLVLNDTQRYADGMRRDVQAIMLCHQIVVLDGWAESRGAKVEVALAQILGIPVIRFWNRSEVTETVLLKVAL